MKKTGFIIALLFIFIIPTRAMAAEDYSQGLVYGQALNIYDYRSPTIKIGSTTALTDNNLSTRYNMQSPIRIELPEAKKVTYLSITYQNESSDILITVVPASGSRLYYRLGSRVLEEHQIPINQSITSVEVNQTGGGYARWIYEFNVFGERDTIPPNPPTGLIGKADDQKINLVWDKNKELDLSHYLVYLDGAFYQRTSENTLTIKGLTNGQAYKVSVSAVDLSGNESQKSDVNVTPKPPPPPDTTPPKPPVLAGEGGDESVNLRWTFDPGDKDIAGVRIYQEGKQIKDIAGTPKVFTVGSLARDTKYKFYITAYDEAGNVSDRSNEIEVKTKKPVTESEQEESKDFLLVTWTKTEGAVGYRVYLNSRQIVEVGPDVFEYKITRAMGYIPGALVNKSEVKAIFSDGSTGGSSPGGGGSGPGGPGSGSGGGGLEGAGYLDFIGVVPMIETAIAFLAIYKFWIILILAVVFSPVLYGLLVRLIDYARKKNWIRS